MEIEISQPYAEIVDRGTISLTVYLSYADGPATLVLDCATPIAVGRMGHVVNVELRAVPAVQPLPPMPPCNGRAAADLGTLDAGAYVVNASLVDTQGIVRAAKQTTFDVLPVAGRCNHLPMIVPQIIAEHETLSPAQLRDRVLSDRDYAARLGSPVVETHSLRSTDGGPDWALLDYPPLINPVETRALLEDTGEFRHVWGNGPACGLPPPDGSGAVIEYYNARFDHFFYTSNTMEAAILDRGDIAGWVRTGETFPVVTSVGCLPYYPTGGLGVVYRFYGVPGIGPDSHFFTIDRRECYVVDRTKQWTFEGVAFWAVPVDQRGACPDPATQQPLYRLWRPFGDSNHRYTTRASIVDTMVAQRWIAEGPAMCVSRSAAR